MDDLLSDFVTFYHNNTEVCIAVLAAIVGFALFKPKYIWKMLIAVVALVVVVSAISMLGDTLSEGAGQKEKMSDRTDKAIEGSDL